VRGEAGLDKLCNVNYTKIDTDKLEENSKMSELMTSKELGKLAL